MEIIEPPLSDKSLIWAVGGIYFEEFEL